MAHSPISTLTVLYLPPARARFRPAPPVAPQGPLRAPVPGLQQSALRGLRALALALPSPRRLCLHPAPRGLPPVTSLDSTRLPSSPADVPFTPAPSNGKTVVASPSVSLTGSLVSRQRGSPGLHVSPSVHTQQLSFHRGSPGDPNLGPSPG